jgi:hypothetical protein
MKLRNASAKMASGTVNVRVTMIGPKELGIRCFHTSLDPLAPSEREASAPVLPTVPRLQLPLDPLPPGPLRQQPEQRFGDGEDARQPHV